MSSKKNEKLYTAKEVCAEVGIHKTTLVRIHSRGEIEEVQWKIRPQPHRVYTRKQINDIIKVVDSNKPTLPIGAKVVGDEQ